MLRAAFWVGKGVRWVCEERKLWLGGVRVRDVGRRDDMIVGGSAIGGMD